MPVKVERKHIIPIVLLIIAGIQAWLAMDDYGLRWLKATWRTRQLTAEQRSARFLFGDEGYQYIDFLKASIPESGTVVKPDGVGALSQQSNVQFLLLPRRIPTCPCTTLATEVELMRCESCLNKEGHVVLAIADYPPKGFISPSKRLIEFPLDSETLHGFYATDNALHNWTTTVDGATSKAGLNNVVFITFDLLIILGFYFIGLSINRILLSSRREHLSILFGLPVGMGTTTFSLFVIGWLGLPINELTISLLFIALLLILVFTLHSKTWSLLPSIDLRQISHRFPNNTVSRFIAFLAIGLLLVMFTASLLISVGRSYSTYDGIANWALKGYAIAEFDTIFAGQDWGGHGLSYPQNIHLATGIFRSLTGDTLPGSKVLHPIFFITITLVIIAYLYEKFVDSTQVLAGGVLLATIPFPFFHSTLGFANIIFTGYILGGTFILLDSLERDNRGEKVLAGLLYGFAAWTRPEGIYFGLALIFTILLLHILRSKNWKDAIRVFTPFAVIAFTWQSFGTRYQANDEIGRVLASLFQNASQGSIQLEPFQVLSTFAFSHFSQPGKWGLAALVVIAGIIATLISKRLRSQPTTVSIWTAAAVGFILPLSLLLASGLARGGFIGFLRVSFDRAMIPGVILLTTAALYSLLKSTQWHHLSSKL